MISTKSLKKEDKKVFKLQKPNIQLILLIIISYNTNKIVNLEKKHEKIKIFRRFNQDKKKEEIIPDELNKQTFENKLEKFEKIQKMIQAYDEKLGLPQDPAKIEKKSNVNKVKIIHIY